MKATNSWPELATHVPLTLAAAATAKAAYLSGGSVLLAVAFTDNSLTEESLDQDLEDYFNRNKSDESMHNDFTDLYVLSSFHNPFSEPHLLFDALLHATIPTSPLPLSVPINAMIDMGCPPTVISGALVATLGLPLIPLPPKEDNLSSLSNSRLPCN